MSNPLDSGRNDAGPFGQFESEHADSESVEEPFEREPFEHESPEDVLAPDDPDPSTDPADGSADPELRVLFWKLVLLYKVAILGGTLGVLLVVFDQGPAVGPELLAGAALLFGYALYATRRGKERVDAGEFGDESPDTDAGDGAVGAGGGDGTDGERADSADSTEMASAGRAREESRKSQDREESRKSQDHGL